MALIPAHYIDCVVALGIDAPDGKPSWIASGFLYGHRAATKDTNHNGYHVFLATNRHVVQGHSRLHLRFNPQGTSEAKAYELILVDPNGKLHYSGHSDPKVDVVTVPINFSKLQKDGIQAKFFHNDVHAAPVPRMKEIGVAEGDFVYVLGFPMGMVGEKRNAVIVRSGSIARIRDTLADQNPTFLLDLLIFPGNSGGPVFLKPELTSITGTQPQQQARLIGIVQSYVPYQDTAVSCQTGRPRIVFEENTGLATAYPIDFVDQTIATHLKKLEPTETC